MFERASLFVDTFADERKRVRLTAYLAAVRPKIPDNCRAERFSQMGGFSLRNEHKTPARRFSAGE